jgi:hypothetical protein
VIISIVKHEFWSKKGKKPLGVILRNQLSSPKKALSRKSTSETVRFYEAGRVLEGA